MNKLNKITIKRILRVIGWIGLAWITYPTRCSSESCAYNTVLAGTTCFLFLIISSILVLELWSKIFTFDNRYNFKSVDIYVFIGVTVFNILMWLYLLAKD